MREMKALVACQSQESFQLQGTTSPCRERGEETPLWHLEAREKEGSEVYNECRSSFLQSCCAANLAEFLAQTTNRTD